MNEQAVSITLSASFTKNIKKASHSLLYIHIGNMNNYNLKSIT